MAPMFPNDDEALPPYLPPQRPRADPSTQVPSRLMKYKSWSPDIDREETWLRRKNLHKERRRAAIQGTRLDGSVTDEDVDELRACIDLGFGLGFGDEEVRSSGGDGGGSSDGGSSRLAETFPALDLYYAVNQNRSDFINGDGVTGSDSSSNGSSPLRLYTPGNKDESFCRFFNVS